MWTLAGGYAVLHEPAGDLDVFAGTRLLNFSSTLNWNFAGPIGSLAKSGSVEDTKNFWDGIVGVKGELRFGQSNWFMPYYADIGAGSNNWTWQAALGAGYRFSWGDVVFKMRSLTYNSDDRPAHPAHDRTGAGRVVQVLSGHRSWGQACMNQY